MNRFVCVLIAASALLAFVPVGPVTADPDPCSDVVRVLGSGSDGVPDAVDHVLEQCDSLDEIAFVEIQNDQCVANCEGRVEESVTFLTARDGPLVVEQDERTCSPLGCVVLEPIHLYLMECVLEVDDLLVRSMQVNVKPNCVVGYLDCALSGGFCGLAVPINQQNQDLNKLLPDGPPDDPITVDNVRQVEFDQLSISASAPRLCSAQVTVTAFGTPLVGVPLAAKPCA